MEKAEQDAILAAISGRISQCTIPFCVVGASLKGATAVLVEVDNRLFALTCNHTIPANQDDIWIISSRRIAKSHYIHNDIVIDSWRSPDPWLDAGLIELHPENTRKLFDSDIVPLTLDEISLSFDVGRVAVASGYPGELVENSQIVDSESGRHVEFKFQGITIPAEPMPVNEWPVVRSPPDPASNPEVDIYLPYEQGKVVEVEHGGKRFNKAQAHPGGLSGCGVWQAKPYKEGIWTPDLRLVGIQSRSVPKKYLRAIRIRPVLELLASIDESLKDRIDPILE